MNRDTDDSYDPTEHTYPAWEGELTTTDGVDWYLIVIVHETREPVLLNGKLCGESSYSLDDAQVFPHVADTYAQESLTGAALAAWLATYATEVAVEVADRWHDAWVADAERRDAGEYR